MPGLTVMYTYNSNKMFKVEVIQMTNDVCNQQIQQFGTFISKKGKSK